MVHQLKPRYTSLVTGVTATLVAVACSTARYSAEPGNPSIILPAHFAEGQGEPGAAAPGARRSAAASASSPAPTSSSSSAPAEPALTPSALPDPTPLRMAEQVEYELELADGKIRVVSVKAVKLSEPIVTPRRLGRYAIELVIGHELIDRVRFDFPGTAADDPQIGPKKPLYAPLTLSEHAIGHVTLRLPQSPRVRRAQLVDRGLNTATALEWPLPNVPKAPPAPPSSAAPSGSVAAPPAASALPPKPTKPQP